MTDHRSARRPLLLAAGAVLVGGLSLAGLAGDEDTGSTRPGGGGTTVTVHADPPEPADPVAAFDWARPTTVDLGGGWAVTDTEGNGPFVTVLRDGRAVGFLEYLDYPLESPAGDGRASLDAHVADYFDDIGRDRAESPIAGYRFLPDRPEHLDAADGAIVRYGFRGTLPDGRPSERSIQWAGIRGGRLVLVAANASDEGGLFGREGVEFTSADLDEVAGRLDRLVRASGLPPQPAPLG